jgi:hypothetical protein
MSIRREEWMDELCSNESMFSREYIYTQKSRFSRVYQYISYAGRSGWTNCVPTHLTLTGLKGRSKKRRND